MHTSIATFVWTGSLRDEDFDLLPRVAAHGYDALEVVYDGSHSFDPARMAEGLRSAGLGASVLAFCLPDRDLTSLDPVLRQAGITYLKNAVDVAAAIGASVVAGPIVHPPGRARLVSPQQRDDERMHGAEGLRIVGDYAITRGVRLGVEVLCRYDSDMFNLAQDAVAFIDTVGHSAVGLLLDTYHMQIEERSLAGAIRIVGDRLVHFHAVESHRGQLGTGQVRWDEVIAALAEINYGGLVSVESFRYSGTDFDALVNMWRPWFEDPDQFAKSSFDFLTRTICEVTSRQPI